MHDELRPQARIRRAKRKVVRTLGDLDQGDIAVIDGRRYRYSMRTPHHAGLYPEEDEFVKDGNLIWRTLDTKAGEG